VAIATEEIRLSRALQSLFELGNNVLTRRLGVDHSQVLFSSWSRDEVLDAATVLRGFAQQPRGIGSVTRAGIIAAVCSICFCC
jgi:hypothetical protein